MREEWSGTVDTSRCFGRYRSQSPQYALAVCVRCPKLKSCVRTVWGLEAPRRTARRNLWWEPSPRGALPPRPPGADAGYHLAT
jgi:hypothetical protein